MAKNIVCNVRMTEDERYALRAVALKNKTTVQNLLYEAAKKYITEKGDDDDPLLTGTPNAETLEAVREIENGQFTKYASTRELYEDLGI